MPDDPARPPRFPYVAALLCAVCLGAAAYLWMRYSWVWGLSSTDVDEKYSSQELQSAWDGRYVRTTLADIPSPRARKPEAGTMVVAARIASAAKPSVDARGGVWEWPINICIQSGDAADAWTRHQCQGRLRWQGDIPTLDTTVSRFHGASVAGLVVGAMGVFVLMVALRHWLGDRRKFRQEARA